MTPILFFLLLPVSYWFNKRKNIYIRFNFHLIFLFNLLELAFVLPLMN